MMPNKLWKHITHQGMGDSLFLVGLARPQQINLACTCEMQARTIALVLYDQRQLPPAIEQIKTIGREQRWMQQQYKERIVDVPALVDCLFYTESLAKFVVCQVPICKVWLSDPVLGFKLLCASMNGAHYRLQGLGANWEDAAKAIKATTKDHGCFVDSNEKHDFLLQTKLIFRE